MTIKHSITLAANLIECSWNPAYSYFESQQLVNPLT